MTKEFWKTFEPHFKRRSDKFMNVGKEGSCDDPFKCLGVVFLILELPEAGNYSFNALCCQTFPKYLN